MYGSFAVWMQWTIHWTINQTLTTPTDLLVFSFPPFYDRPNNCTLKKKKQIHSINDRKMKRETMTMLSTDFIQFYWLFCGFDCKKNLRKNPVNSFEFNAAAICEHKIKNTSKQTAEIIGHMIVLQCNQILLAFKQQRERENNSNDDGDDDDEEAQKNNHSTINKQTTSTSRIFSLDRYCCGK